MSPWKCAWEGSDAVCGTKSSSAFDKPPISASDMVLHSVTELGSEKVMRGNGRFCNRTVSNLMAMCSFSTSSREKAASYLVPIRDTRLNSSRLRFQKPGGAINLLVHCIAERLVEGCGDYGSMGNVLLWREIVWNMGRSWITGCCGGDLFLVASLGLEIHG